MKPTKQIYTGKHAVLTGDIRIGGDISIWHNAVVRADTDVIEIGPATNIQDGCLLHTDAGYPVVIGADCTIGHGAILHGCTLEDKVLVGMGAIIMNGAKIGKHSIIGAGALVLENMEIPAGSLVVGSPARIIRQTTPQQHEEIAGSAAEYVEHARKQLQQHVLDQKDDSGLYRLDKETVSA